MAILVTGGTGKTGTRLARLLHDAGHSVYVASRSPDRVSPPLKEVQFDWDDESTRENPFNAASSADEHIDGIYLVGPPVPDMAAKMNPFIDLAIKHGVKRFVLIGASQVEKGSPPMGVVQEYLEKLGADYCTLRPSWFQENFLVPHFHQPLLNEDRIVSATGDGRIPFISADDIADAAFKALTVDTIEERDLLVFGPELLTYDEVATVFTEVLGRSITHARVSEEEVGQHLLRLQFHAPISKILAALDTVVAAGGEEGLFKSATPKYVGQRKLRDFIVANRSAWIK